MAHDVEFHDTKTRKHICYFFGYAFGIMYKAFDATHCNNGFSGSNETVVRSAAQIREGVQRIYESGVIANYLDPKRITTACDALLTYIDAHPDARITIWYS